MEKVLIIVYELAVPVMTEKAVTDAIKKLGPWARLTSSSYLVRTRYGPEQVRDYVWQFMHVNDRVYVGRAPAPSAWNGMPGGVTEWIKKNQTWFPRG